MPALLTCDPAMALDPLLPTELRWNRRLISAEAAASQAGAEQREAEQERDAIAEARCLWRSALLDVAKCGLRLEQPRLAQQAGYIHFQLAPPSPPPPT